MSRAKYCLPVPGSCWFFVEDLGIKTEPSGAISRDARNMTSIPGIFVAGDITHGASLVARAMRDGRRAAEGIAAFLKT